MTLKTDMSAHTKNVFCRHHSPVFRILFTTFLQFSGNIPAKAEGPAARKDRAPSTRQYIFTSSKVPSVSLSRREIFPQNGTPFRSGGRSGLLLYRHETRVFNDDRTAGRKCVIDKSRLDRTGLYGAFCDDIQITRNGIRIVEHCF